MTSAFKPTAYNSLSPYFIVSGARNFITFLKQAFDASEVRVYDTPDGSVMHAEVRIDDSILMLGEVSDKFPAIEQLVHLYTKDVDEIYKKAIDLGCASIHPPIEKKDDPDRRCTFKDPFGNTWSVGTQL
jgi:uncharacterized glyoxalase superfamily protein PhnB